MIGAYLSDKRLNVGRRASVNTTQTRDDRMNLRRVFLDARNIDRLPWNLAFEKAREQFPHIDDDTAENVCRRKWKRINDAERRLRNVPLNLVTQR
jgi:hypothetical protein